MLSLANVYELGVILSSLLFIGAETGGDIVFAGVLREDGLAGTGGAFFEDGDGDGDGFRGVE